MKINFKNNLLGYFLFFYSGTGYKLLINFFLCIMVSFLDGIGLAMFMPLLQTVGDKNNGTGKESVGQLHYFIDALQRMGLELNMNTVLMLLVVLFLLKGLLRFAQLNYQVNLIQGFLRKLRFDLVKDLKQINYTGFLRLDAGKIQNIFTTEMQRLFQCIKFYFGAAQSVVMLLTYIVLAFLANYQFAILVAIGSALSNLFYKRIYNATKKASVELSRKGNKFNSFLIQAIHHFKYLKSTNYLSQYSRKLNKVIKESEALNKKIGVYNAITLSLKEPSIIIIVVLVIKFELDIIGASLGSMILSLLLFYRALSFLMLIQNNWQSFISNVGSINSVTDLSKEMKKEVEIQPITPFNTFKNEIQIKDLIFSYGNNRVLNGINFKIPKNQTIALIGESGSGKTTLANIIAYLISPSRGEVLIDEVPLMKYNRNSYRSKIGYISQESVVFNDNVFNNITFWAEPTNENIKLFWEIIELASLKEYVLSLPEKEFTQLGDNGILISGGQRQRISIARELFKNAEILIMDEATSALDSETEKIIQKNIEKLHGRYTIIIIAHRLSTIKNVDMIYLLEKGKITDSGNFAKMLKSSERFKNLVLLQEFKN
jgi:ABC-type multidrug transport system fused ATPase/permease subunit